MANDKPPVPDFLQKFYDGTEEEGHARLDAVARQYEEARQKFMMNEYPAKAAFHSDWQKVVGERSPLDIEKMLEPLKQQYAESAKKVAREFGYVEAEEKPEQEQESQHEKPAEKLHPPKEVELPQTEQQRQEERLSNRDAFKQSSETVGEKKEQKEAQQQGEKEGGESQQESLPQTRREVFLANLREMESKQSHTQRLR